jgi:hypothetical protein
MRKAVYATAILIIVFLIMPIEQSVIVTANMFMYATIEIKSPLDYAHTVYQSSTVNISVAVRIVASNPTVYTISYSLDDKPNETLQLSYENGEYLGTGTLKDLADGYHNLTAYYTGYFTPKDNTASTVFLVNALKQSPTPSIPEFSWLMIVPLFIFTLVGVVAVRYRFNNKKRHQVA